MLFSPLFTLHGDFINTNIMRIFKSILFFEIWKMGWFWVQILGLCMFINVGFRDINWFVIIFRYLSGLPTS